MRKARHHSEETKRKISEAQKGGKNYWFGKRGEAHPMFGHTPWNKGKHWSKKIKKKLSEAHKGQYCSDETREKRSASLKGRSHPWSKGKHLSKEHIRKVSMALKGKYVREKSSAWRGGTSFLPYPPIFNKELKGFIRNRDHNGCQNPYCPGIYDELMIHHIDYDKTNCSQFNLITLCSSCNGQANDKHRPLWQRMYTRIVWSKYP